MDSTTMPGIYGLRVALGRIGTRRGWPEARTIGTKKPIQDAATLLSCPPGPGSCEARSRSAPFSALPRPRREAHHVARLRVILAPTCLRPSEASRCSRPSLRMNGLDVKATKALTVCRAHLTSGGTQPGSTGLYDGPRLRRLWKTPNVS
jgi:hypothetical protein